MKLHVLAAVCYVKLRTPTIQNYTFPACSDRTKSYIFQALKMPKIAEKSPLPSEGRGQKRQPIVCILVT